MIEYVVIRKEKNYRHIFAHHCTNDGGNNRDKLY